METSRLTVVSNRLAIVVDREENGQWIGWLSSYKIITGKIFDMAYGETTCRLKWYP
jgi:hypothetical protein